MYVYTIGTQVLFRHCLQLYLELVEDIIVLGDSNLSDDCLIKLNQLTPTPELVLIDIDHCERRALRFIPTLLESQPNILVVILSFQPKKEDILNAARSGASGFLEKNLDPLDVIKYIRRIYQGEVIFPQRLLIDQIRINELHGDNSISHENEYNLTKRELEVLQQVTYGLMDKQVAVKLELSENTVKNHMKNIRRKLGVSNRLQATIAGIQLGYTSAEHS